MAERNIVGLKCTESGVINYYFSQGKKRRGDRKKVEIKKYSPPLKRHTIHKEVKL